MAKKIAKKIGCIKCGEPSSDDAVDGYEKASLCSNCVGRVMRKRMLKRRSEETRAAARARQRR